MVKNQKSSSVRADNFEANNEEAAKMGIPADNTAQNIALTGEPEDSESPQGESSEVSIQPPAPTAAKSGSVILEALPDDVKKALTDCTAEKFEHEQLVLKCLGYYPHPINVDKIILTLWFKHQTKIDRMKVIARLRDMKADGNVAKIDGTRSLYRLTDQGRSLLG